jgi:predicted ribosomally synthesized peptide with SipW-like signal peptide
MSGKFPGLRTAIITYVLIVVLALCGAAAHALWSQSGTVTVNVTAGHWGPTGTVKIDTCKQDPQHKYSVVTVEWKAVDGATNYDAYATAEGKSDRVSASVAQTGNGFSATLELGFDNESNNGKGRYTLTITPMADKITGTPTTVNIVLSGKKETTCTI